MKFATVRDFRSNASKLLNAVRKEGEVVVTKRGKPVALLLPLSEKEFPETLRLIRQVRFQQTLWNLREQAKQSGTDKMTMEEIDAEIKAARRVRKTKISA